jgi:hypothetical protein
MALRLLNFRVLLLEHCLVNKLAGSSLRTLSEKDSLEYLGGDGISLPNSSGKRRFWMRSNDFDLE